MPSQLGKRSSAVNPARIEAWNRCPSSAIELCKTSRLQPSCSNNCRAQCLMRRAISTARHLAASRLALRIPLLMPPGHCRAQELRPPCSSDSWCRPHVPSANGPNAVVSTKDAAIRKSPDSCTAARIAAFHCSTSYKTVQGGVSLSSKRPVSSANKRPLNTTATRRHFFGNAIMRALPVFVCSAIRGWKSFLQDPGRCSDAGGPQERATSRTRFAIPPAATLLVCIAIMIPGLLCAGHMPRTSLPNVGKANNVDFNSVSVMPCLMARV